jgi:three-Cys-motif partner protein
VTGRKHELDETIWSIEPHTTLKHLAYRVYLECWMAKILTTFPQAYIVDAFSGPGVYKKDQPGSPIVAANAYLGHSRRSKFGRLTILCSEKRADRVARLHEEVSKLERTPNLVVDPLPPGVFADRLDQLISHTRRSPNAPVLWILDPFDISSVGMVHLEKCLAGQRNEVILTFFVDEMNRFAEGNPNMAPALDRQYGNNSWRNALSEVTESNRKQAFTSEFRSALGQRCGVLTSSFGISVRNATSRYDLVFATGSDAGLECWTKMTWRIDTITGRRSSAATAEQPDLFGIADTSDLEAEILKRAGDELGWTELVALASRAQFKETHLRQALTALNDRGLAFRIAPIEAQTPWPSGSRVQVHSPDELRESSAQ